ncbi:G patch domain and ankyrin repeat-containing protein 1 homolog isoform X1 [Haemaphysalis longicornis]
MSAFRRVTFVRSAEQNVSVTEPVSRVAQNVCTLSGESARRFYESTVSQPSTSTTVTRDDPPSPKHRSSKCPNEKLKHSKTANRAVKTSDYFTAAQTNDVSELKRCLESGVNIDATDMFGWTALMCASCAGATDSVRYLLKKRANPDLRNKQNVTALDLAAKRGHVNVVELFCKPEKRGGDGSVLTVQDSPQTQCESDQFCSVCDALVTAAQVKAHSTSIAHQFNLRLGKSPAATHYGIPESNAGFQMLVGMGWNREKGVGSREEGRKFPVKTVLKRDRGGLGGESSVPRVTHFGPHDRSAVENLRKKESRESVSQSLKRKRKEDEKRSLRLRRMELEFRRSFL